MTRKSKRFHAFMTAFGMAALLLALLFGAVSAAPRESTRMAASSTNALLGPAAQAVTGSVQVQPAPQGQTGGAGGTGGTGAANGGSRAGGTTSTTTNVNISIPGWVWIVVVLLLVVIVALIASGSRGGGTTVIKD